MQTIWHGWEIHVNTKKYFSDTNESFFSPVTLFDMSLFVFVPHLKSNRAPDQMK